MNMIAPRIFSQDYEFPGSVTPPKPGVVVIVSDDLATIESLAPVCEFLDLKMEFVSSTMDLIDVLHECQPMAVISDVEGEHRDGFHTMKQVARYDRDLPMMLLTAGDPVLMGAADAMQTVCGLTAVTATSGFPPAGQLVAFLFSAGRRAGCMRLVPI